MEQKCAEKNTHPPISNHVLVLMVRGIFFTLEFPYANFGTKGVTADFVFPIVCEGIRQLESIGFKVICVTADGPVHARPNKKIFRMHRKAGDLVYNTHNDPTEKQPLLFISDPPHLIKTTRNCWSHSGTNGTRLMTVNMHTVKHNFKKQSCM